MATLRHEIRIHCAPATVWARISDTASICSWYPLIVRSGALTDGKRFIELQGGQRVEEEIVTNDSALRRLQYRISGGDIPVDAHLGTVDVLDLDGDALVIYSTDILPDPLAAIIGPAMADALVELRRQAEQ